MMIYRNFTRRTIKCFLPSKLVENIAYYNNYHRFVDWKHPVTLDEKLMYLKADVYKNNALVKQCTDKYRVREYIRNKECGEILIPLYDVLEFAEDLRWTEYPEKFMLKCNHGCGYNILVDRGIGRGTAKESELLNRWMKLDYGLVSGEYHYRNIQRKILVEKYIGSGTDLPVDYKFFCSRGKVICVLIIFGRGKKQELLFVDVDFDILDYTAKNKYSGRGYKEQRPAHWKEMLGYAERLSEDFPFVRVDLYDTDQVYFGELTFSPHGCIHTYMYPEAQLEIGKQIILHSAE